MIEIDQIDLEEIEIEIEKMKTQETHEEEEKIEIEEEIGKRKYKLTKYYIQTKK